MEKQINSTDPLIVKFENGVLNLGTYNVNLIDLINHLDSLKDSIPMSLKGIINVYTQLLTFSLLDSSNTNEIVNIIEENQMVDVLQCLYYFIDQIEKMNLA